MKHSWRIGGKRLVIACDYDRTLTEGSHNLSREVAEKLSDMKSVLGFVLIIASGRRLGELLELIDGLAASCDALVAENGALVYDLKRGLKVKLSEGMKGLREALRASGIDADFGEVVVSVKRSEYARLLDILRSRGIEAELTFNVDALMVLPRGVNKGEGLRRALEIIGVNDAFIIAFGDGENDLDLFRVADVKVAVANASEILRREADVVSKLSDGSAVIDYIATTLL